MMQPNRPILELEQVSKHFPVRSGALQLVRGHAQAVDGVDLSLHAGETLGLVGESGSGKSTLGRVALRLLEPTAGRIRFEGRDVTDLGGRALRPLRREMQMVFQDPYASFDPRSTVANSVGEPLRTHGWSREARRERLMELVELVGMNTEHLRRYPQQFSGGQLQRLAIARALSVQPSVIVCDEPVSSLDVSTQAQVINLLGSLQRELGVAYLFIAHDLALVRHISHRIAVMYLGRIVELGTAEEVYTRPTHPYTEALLSAIPVPDPDVQHTRERIVLRGDVPSPIDPPHGCRFHTRCPYVMDVCRDVDPPAFETPAGSVVHCHLHTDGPRLAGRTVRSVEVPAAQDG